MDRAEKEEALRQIREDKETIRQKMLYYRRKIDNLTTHGTTYVDAEGQSRKRLEYWNKIKELSDRDKELDILRSRIRQEFFVNPIRFLLGNPQLTFDDIPEKKPIEEVHKYLEEKGIKPEDTGKAAVWRVNNTYNGIEIKFDSKPPEEIRTKMKRAGFKWSGRSGVWYAKDSTYTRQIASELADQEEAVGEKLSYAEQVEAERQRAIARQGRLEKAAEKAEVEAERRFETAHKMADVIPFGQPILVGHHSEKSDRSFRARIDTHQRKGMEAYEHAKELKSRLEGSERLLQKQEDPGAVARKLEKFETELRRLKLHEDWYKDKSEFSQKVADYEEKIAYWKKFLADLGGLKVSSKDIHPGDYVKYRGSWYKVKRANPKTVTILGWMGKEDWTYPAEYSYITEVRHAKANPRDVIGSPPNFIMKLQLFKLWKEVLGAEDIGDFETFMKEVSDLTYDEAKEKLFRTYGQPKQMTSGYLSAKASDAEAKIHASLCDSAAEECDKGDPEACRVACQDCGITEFCPPEPKKPEYSWRKFPDHKSETKAVKDALKKAGIDAEVKHGTGTAWGWLDINIGDPRKRGGLKPPPFEYQYTDEEQALQKKALKIAQEITGRHGDYDGRISVLAQEWRHRVRPVKEKPVEAAKPEPEVKPEPKETVKPIVHGVKSVVQSRRLAQRLADVTGMPVALPPAQQPAQKPRKAPGKAVKPQPKAKPSTVIKKIPRSGIVRLTEKDMKGTIVLKW